MQSYFSRMLLNFVLIFLFLFKNGQAQSCQEKLSFLRENSFMSEYFVNQSELLFFLNQEHPGNDYF